MTSQNARIFRFKKPGIHVCIEQNDAVLHIVEGVTQYLQFIGMPNDIGNVRVAEHAAAIREDGALQSNGFTAGATQVERCRVTIPDQARDTFGNIGIEFGRGGLISIGIAAVIHQRDESRISIRGRVGQRPHAAEGPIDELGFHVAVEQDDADLDFVERRA